MGCSMAELVAYLDGYLRVSEVPDSPSALNGLQVENGGSVSRVVAAVDAVMAAPFVRPTTTRVRCPLT